MADEMMVKELEEVVVRFSGDSGDGTAPHQSGLRPASFPQGKPFSNSTFSFPPSPF